MFNIIYKFLAFIESGCSRTGMGRKLLGRFGACMLAVAVIADRAKLFENVFSPLRS